MWQESVDILVYDKLSLSKDDSFANALNFFIYDSVKIFFLLITIIFAVSFLRSYFSVEKVRAYLATKSPLTGNILASLFGIITPFCTCSAIPLFLGFLSARIPLGVTFSFLISSPMNNEIAIAMLFSIFGFEITALYILFGLSVAIIGGFIIGRMNLDRYVLIDVPKSDNLDVFEERLSIKQRVANAIDYTKDILKKVYLYVLIGIAIGGFIHGYVPVDFITEYAGGDSILAPFVAVIMGIPMYSNAAGVMPLVEVLTQKGMLIGTALSFMMAVTALSLPEAIILKKILHTRLIAIFFAIVGSGIVAIGYIFNFLLV
jgi:uncharacterized membrane protein YraQ (UPF0718 family)